MAKRDIQYRTSFDFRASDGVDGFEGHAASWWSVDSYGTAFAPGAFKRTIRNRTDKIPVLWNHNVDAPIGKHLELKEDDHGLYVNVGIADDGAEGTTTLKRLRFGVPLGLSFGFETMQDRTAEDDDPLDMSSAPSWLGSGKDARKNVRVITEVKHWESSPVTFASNENSTIDAIRSARMEQEADFLSSLLEDLRAGSLPEGDARDALLRDLVLAYQERPGLGASPATTPLGTVDARRRKDRDARFAAARLAVLGVTQP